MNHLAKVERERRLRKIRGPAGASSRSNGAKRTGPRWDALDVTAQVEFGRYAREAGIDWRTDLIADCIRGGTRRRARFLDVLCPLIRQHGVAWLRQLSPPWASTTRRRGRAN